MKIVLDTNVIVSGIFWKGTSFEIIRRWAADLFQVFITGEMLEEYKIVLERLDPVHLSEFVTTQVPTARYLH